MPFGFGSKKKGAVTDGGQALKAQSNPYANVTQAGVNGGAYVGSNDNLQSFPSGTPSRSGGDSRGRSTPPSNSSRGSNAAQPGNDAYAAKPLPYRNDTSRSQRRGGNPNEKAADYMQSNPYATEAGDNSLAQYGNDPMPSNPYSTQAQSIPPASGDDSLPPYGSNPKEKTARYRPSNPYTAQSGDNGVAQFGYDRNKNAAGYMPSNPYSTQSGDSSAAQFGKTPYSRQPYSYDDKSSRSQRSGYGYPDDKPPGYQASNPYSRSSQQAFSSQPPAYTQYDTNADYSYGGGNNNGDDADDDDNRDVLFDGAAKRYKSRPKQQPQDDDNDDSYANGYGQAPDSDAVGPDPELDPEEAAVFDTKSKIRNTKKETLDALQTALQSGRETNERLLRANDKLDEQANKLQPAEMNFDHVTFDGTKADASVKEIKRLNRSIFLPSGSKKKNRGKDGLDAMRDNAIWRANEDQVRATYQNTKRSQMERDQKIMDAVVNNRKTNTSNKSARDMYQFEADSEDDEMEDQIDDGLDQLGDVVSNMKANALRLQGRTEDSLRMLDNISRKADMASDKLAESNSKLAALGSKK